MTEDLTFDEGVGNCSGIDCDKWTARALAQAVNRPCCEFFTSSAFAGNDGRCITRAEALDKLVHLLHGSARADELAKAGTAFEL